MQSIVDVFEGQPLTRGQFEVDLNTPGSIFTELGISNALTLSDERILSNVQKVEQANDLPVLQQLDGLNFSVEMETGTGKTYIYLRTIHELHAKYGFLKYIIIVPSVAIREGVLKNLDITSEHFAKIYGNQPIDYWVYDSKRVSSLRQFANSNSLQVLVINIDAFNKKSNNIIHKENDRLSGRKPIEFIQSTNPIVIIDEPQNMESDQARQAIASLNPLCTLRYSATHRNQYNLMYRLDPVRAHDMNLVKRIEVASVLDEADFNQPYIYVESIQATKAKISAKLVIDAQRADGVKRTTVTLNKSNCDLYKISGEREAYRGYLAEDIHAGRGYIAFSNGISLNVGESIGSNIDDVMRVQIEETVKEHLEKELYIQSLLPDGNRIKVLSLFFIDRVANYNRSDGKIRKYFEAAYQHFSLLKRYQSLNLPPLELVHNGYFAQSRGQTKDTSGNTQADDEVYELIMKEKERLLSYKEPLRFIFSHSALREGWDNPNVFQICTLNETKSELKKRQEIGRGLRLPVDELGRRVFDHNINQLTVIANESYVDFARALQNEMEQDCGVKFEGRIVNRRERRKAQLKKAWRFDENFLALWERIKHKTRYSVCYKTEDLVKNATKNLFEMPEIQRLKAQVEKVSLDISKTGIDTKLLSAKEMEIGQYIGKIPDLISHIQKETELTRGTIAEILIRSKRITDVTVNPQVFLEQSTKIIKQTLQEMMVDGIQYERVDGAQYEMRLFEDPRHEIRGYLSRMLEVKKSIYDVIEYDSTVEENFARDLDAREDIKLFLKLPQWFKVDTPLGTYNPDWAIVKQSPGEEEKLYLVSETKATTDVFKLRQSEKDKIKCGRIHFSVLPGVKFKQVRNATEI